ncbi:hypothetical protein E2P81_ATG01520 [Venturia nashicola]|nr:hypothetical protein E2P81_ATG01520 [Venturia nashicola]
MQRRRRENFLHRDFSRDHKFQFTNIFFMCDRTNIATTSQFDTHLVCIKSMLVHLHNCIFRNLFPMTVKVGTQIVPISFITVKASWLGSCPCSIVSKPALAALITATGELAWAATGQSDSCASSTMAFILPLKIA